MTQHCEEKTYKEPLARCLSLRHGEEAHRVVDYGISGTSRTKQTGSDQANRQRYEPGRGGVV